MSGNLDPRDLDSREREDGIHDREHEYLSLGRGGGGGLTKDSDEDTRDRDSDWRPERDREGPGRHDGRALDPRDAFVRDLDLPRGHDWASRDRDREYSPAGAADATVGAFRVVGTRSLRCMRRARSAEPRDQDIPRVPLNEHERAHTLTQDGRC